MRSPGDTQCLVFFIRVANNDVSFRLLLAKKFKGNRRRLAQNNASMLGSDHFRFTPPPLCSDP